MIPSASNHPTPRDSSPLSHAPGNAAGDFRRRTPISAAGWAGMLSLLLAGMLAGCETTDMVTYETDSGAYHDAQSFLKTDITTRARVEAKFGRPNRIVRRPNGFTLWQYRRREEVVVSAYSGTSLGTDATLFNAQPGFRHTVPRRPGMDLLFDSRGILRAYRVYRNAPPLEPDTEQPPPESGKRNGGRR